jgi:hypothetical protein
VVMVVRDRRTSKRRLALALRRLEPLAGKLVGVVLNDERQGGAAAGYAYRYEYATGRETPARG